MNTELLRALTMCETDVDGSLKRFAGDEELYVAYLKEFLTEPTMAELEEDVTGKKWDDAFVAAHALKGLAGNLGFVPLFHAIGELVLVIRARRFDEVTAVMAQVRESYNGIIIAIKQGN